MQSRDNVTDISTLVSPFPQESTLYFPVIERRDGWQDIHGTWHYDDSVKKLVRMKGKLPIVLATVGSGYRTILNRDLFQYIEKHMQTRFDPHMLRDVSVKDEMAYNGRDTFRHYTFPSIRCDIADRGDIAFKIIVGNGYGSKAIQLVVGAIDFYCSNGMIIGTFEKIVRKHTSGLTLKGIDMWLDGSVNLFTKHSHRLQRWNDTSVTNVTALMDHLIEKDVIAKRSAAKLAESIAAENMTRNPNSPPTLWNVYSALTAWATHDSVRDTGTDHTAVTRIARSKHVERVISVADAFVRREAA